MNHLGAQPEPPRIHSQVKEILAGYDLSGCFQQVDGVNIFSVDKGKGPPVVFIHGLSSSLFTWRYNLKPLSQCCRIIALDLPGFGLSQKLKTKKPSLTNYVNFVHRFLKKMGLVSAILVGHSFGGTVCLELCRKFAGLAEALILVSATDKGSAEISEKKIKNLLLYLYHDKTFITPELYTIFKFTSKNYLPDGLLSLLQSSGDSMINLLKVPCRIIWGQYDALLAPDKAQEVAARFKAAEISIFPDCGHAPHEEKYEAFNDLIVRFLGENQLNLKASQPPYCHWLV